MINIKAPDSNEEYAKSVAQEMNIPKAYSSLKEMLKKEKIDAISICSIPQDHLKDSITAFENGCHVLLEKPIAMNMEEVKKIKKAQEKAGKILSVVHNSRFYPGIREGINLVKEGKIGDVLHVTFYEMKPINIDRMAVPNHWSLELKGGRLSETIPHKIYTLYQLVGKMKVKSVETKLMNKDHAYMGIDEATITLEHDKGFSEYYMSEHNGKTVFADMVIAGTNGAIICNGREAHILNEKKDSSPISNMLDVMFKSFRKTKPINPGIEGHHQIVQGFVNEILKDAEPLVSWEEAYHTMEIVDKIGEQIDSQLKKGK